MFIEGAAISHNANNDYLERLYVYINMSAGAFCCLDANKGCPYPSYSKTILSKSSVGFVIKT